MKIIAHKTLDGKIFEDHDKALAYCEDSIGEAIEHLFKGSSYMGIQLKMEVLRTVTSKEEEFKTLNKWVKHFHEIEKEG